MLIIPKLYIQNRQKSYAYLLKREAIWAWYRMLCKLEHEPVFEMRYDIDLIKPNGKIEDKINGRAESYVRNFYNFLAQNMLQIQPSTYSMGGYGVGSLTIKDTGATERTTQYTWAPTVSLGNVEALNDLSVSGVGVRIATGLAGGLVFDDSDTLYNFEQTTAVSLIENGTGVGQLVYGDTFLPYLTYDSGSDKWTCIWERMALNNEAATQVSVDVKSICLYARPITVAINTAIMAMFARDVLVSTITVPYTYQIKGRWTLTHER